MPLIVRVPGMTEAGGISAVPVTSTDFFPTMLELAGIAMPPAAAPDGVSLVPALKGRETLDREELFWHYPHYHGSAWKPGGAMRSGDWKLIEFYEEDRIELYHLGEDLGERNDLASQRPEKAAELHNRFRAWRRAVGAAMPQPNPEYTP